MADAPLHPAPREPVEPPPPLLPPRARGRRRIAVAAIAVLLVLAGIAWAVRHRSSRTDVGPGGPGAQARPVPVVAAPVVRRDVPVSLEGLGTVVAFRTVTVRPQVDGRLDQVLFREGQPVKAGQVLAHIDDRPFQIQLRQAQGALARDTAQLESAKRDLQRYQELAKEKLIAQQQADQQVGAVGQLEGSVRVDQAAVESARLNIDYARITSPVDGVTGIRQVDPGNLVHQADPNGIVIVTQLDPIAVVFTLPQDALPQVAEAMSHGDLRVEAFSRDGTASLGSGKLELVDNQIVQATSTIRLKAILPNPKRVLWPNQFVKARLALSVQRGALVVPAAAVQRGPNGPFAYVIGADSTVSPRAIELASSEGDLAVVARGLEPGERVVVEGQGQLR
ncbi:MAG TPA: efflux RND transporter periplasmic adaptor subunit, partial [Anaeromyxobacter sp.]